MLVWFLYSLILLLTNKQWTLSLRVRFLLVLGRREAWESGMPCNVLVELEVVLSDGSHSEIPRNLMKSVIRIRKNLGFAAWIHNWIKVKVIWCRKWSSPSLRRCVPRPLNFQWFGPQRLSYFQLNSCRFFLHWSNPSDLPVSNMKTFLHFGLPYRL